MAIRSETDGGWGEEGSVGGNAAERPGNDGAAEQGCVAEQGAQPSKVAHAARRWWPPALREPFIVPAHVRAMKRRN